jgi:hypothetical protein
VECLVGEVFIGVGCMLASLDTDCERLVFLVRLHMFDIHVDVVKWRLVTDERRHHEAWSPL